MIAITYLRNGITYDHLRFKSIRFMRKWMRMLERDGVTVVRVELC